VRIETPGASRSRISTRVGTTTAAVASAMASVKVLLASEATNWPGVMEDSSCRRASATAGHRAWARGVGSTP